MSENATTCECGGSGKVDYVHREPDDTERDLGHGLVGGPITTHGTRLCAFCREGLEPREGEAAWWTKETIYAAEWTGEVFDLGATVTVEAEVPISEDNYPLIRSDENRYYPTAIDLEVGRGERTVELPWIWPHEARALARMLNPAADACDDIDLPNICPDCSCWRSVCSCKEATASA